MIMISRLFLFLLLLLLLLLPLLRGAESETDGPSDKPKTVPGNLPVAIRPGPEGDFTLVGRDAAIFGQGTRLISGTKKDYPQAALAGWMSPRDRAEWQLRGLVAGRYDLLVSWAMPRHEGGVQQALITLDGRPIFRAKPRTTGEGEESFASFVIGTIELPAGDHRIGFGPRAPVKNSWGRLRSLRLVPAASDGEFRQPPLTVPDGFSIEPAAIPPLVSHPMMACLDDRGRLFIAESAGTNAKAAELLKTRPHKILMLEDADGDGVFDHSTVFAENLVLPNGAQWHDGALYVCSPPYIWKFEDLDDDGKAEKQTPVGGKFGFNGMSSAFHGPVLGPDGRLYYCGGQHGWTLGDTSSGLDLKREKWTSRAPGVFSMWPDGSDPRNRAQGGMANPVEVTFSPEGEVFGTVAVYQNLKGRTDALLHWIHGSVYNLRREPVHPRTSRTLLAPMSRRGWVAPPGLTRYRSGDFGTGFGADYRNDIFMAEFNTHRVYRIKPQRRGASYITSDEVFLESSSPYTHFTDVFEDADGSLLVIDTGGWFLYGCPTSAIERPEVKGAIYRVRKSGGKPVADPRGLQLDWENPQVAWLDDPRFAVRDRAKAELAKLGQAIVPALDRILTSNDSSDQFQRAAIWTLTRIDDTAAQRVIAATLLAGNDVCSPSVRQTAARSLNANLAQLKDDDVIRDIVSSACAIIIDSEQPAELVREAATLLGRLSVPGDPVTILMKAVERNAGKDPYLDHSLIYALIELDHVQNLPTFLTHESPHVRRAALIASAEMKSSALKPEQLLPHLNAEDPDLRAEALRLATGRPGWAGTLIDFLKNALDAEAIPRGISDALLAFSGNKQVQELIADAVKSKSSARKTALDVMQRARLKKLPNSWKAALAAAIAEHPDIDTISTVAALKISEFDSVLIEIAASSQGAQPLRIAALDAVADRLPAPLADEFFDLAVSSFEPDQPTQRRIDAAGILSRANLSERQRQTVASRLIPNAGPLQIGPLLGVFEKRGGLSAETASILAASLEKSPGLFGVPVSRLEAVFAKRFEAAKPILEKLRAAASQRDKRLDELVSQISRHDGKAERGKAAYTKATCVICHKARGAGGIIGPELTTIGAIRSERDLLEAIAFPSATFAREYEPMIVTLKDGTTKLGRLGHETGESVELIDAVGQSERISLDRIANREMAPTSLMPPGLERVLSGQELADLIAYLKSLQ